MTSRRLSGATNGNSLALRSIQGDLIETLEKALEDARSGDLNACVLIAEYDDGYTADWPGAFSTEMDDLSTLVGHLSIAAHFFTMFSLRDDDDEE